MALRNRDKKSYPQFVGRILEWKYSRWEDGKVELVRVAGFDYNVGVTLVNVKNDKENFTCYNGPLSPIRKKSPKTVIPMDMYDKAFGEMLKVLRTNSIFDVDVIQEVSGEKALHGSKLAACAFGQ